MAWTEVDKEKWYSEQTVKRSYKDVIRAIESLRSRFEIVQYGALSLNPAAYPLFLMKTKAYDSSKKTVLITGGVHGYETSGVYGALAFLEREADRYENRFNFVCAPCISPWGYETINRWNPKAIDPNRSFYENSPADESRFLVIALSAAAIKPFAHFDLHETTDTDNTIFRPALAVRDGTKVDLSEIPDGFYVVGDSENPQLGFQEAIVDEVRKVTHIADADSEGRLIGELLAQPGVVNIPVKKIFLCAGLSDAQYTTTTEVYPDSPKVTDEICVDAQVAAIRGGLDYLL